MSNVSFTILKRSNTTKARLGRLETAHGVIDTPMFMPVGTRGAVKTLTGQQVREIGAQIILGNTYHLMLRPGAALIEQAGGLHEFIRWERPILTDSGGFQVFSLAGLRKMTPDGVFFKSHIDGSTHFLGPRESMQIQRALGSDIVMCFDECPPSDAPLLAIEEAVDRTIRWATICREAPLQDHQNLFGIVQGGTHASLRQFCAEQLCKLDFEGFAIGGLSVGETAAEMYATIEATEPCLPENKPRYLMGVGTPRNILESVERGIDLFDCVMPTRNARRGTAFTWQGKLSITSARYTHDFSPLDTELQAYPSSFSKAYIRHLFNVHELTGMTLLSMQNVAFYLDFMRQLRQAIATDTLDDFRKKVDAAYPVREDRSC
jgi:queuine tRNA-ribosyltransferase